MDPNQNYNSEYLQMFFENGVDDSIDCKLILDLIFQMLKSKSVRNYRNSFFFQILPHIFNYKPFRDIDGS